MDLRRYDVKPPRRTRKTIFKYRLWLPRTQRNHPTYVKPTAQPANVGRKPGRSSRPTDTPWEEESAVSLYVFNAAGLAKPHSIEQLTADLASYQSDVAIVTETHFKAKHAHGATNIPGYTLYRRDRTGRRGGGVAIYVRSTLQSATWRPDADDKIYELQWTKVRDDFIGVLYHPPKPLYKTEMLLDYIESAVDEINTTYSGCLITLAGDFNQLTDRDIIERTGLSPIVHQPTRGASVLDRIYVSQPRYSVVRVVSSTAKSDHEAVVAYADSNQCTIYRN